MRYWFSPFIVAAAIAAPTAVAQMYKCAGDGATPIYQDAPCREGRELRNFATDPATVSVLPMRPPPGSTTRLTSQARDKPVKTSKADKKAASAGDPAER